MALHLILMGVQGAGKGEQATYLVDRYQIPQVSTGDLFRAMRTREDEFARRVRAVMDGGNLIDDETTNEVVRERLSQPDAAGGVILDGYPRTPAQADYLNDLLAARGDRVNAVLLLELDLYTAFKRAFGRVKSNATGKTYNIYSNLDGVEWQFVEHETKQFPPRLHAVITETGEVLARRADDANADAILKRIDTYRATTAPLIAYYDAKGLVTRIDADQRIEQVRAAIETAIAAVQQAS